MHTERRSRRFSDLPLAVRIAVLSVGLSAILAFGLTWLGYSRARAGLAEQAEATLAADARGVAEAIDAWHTNRIDVLRTLAQAPTVQRILTSDATGPDDLRDADAMLRGIDRAAADRMQTISGLVDQSTSAARVMADSSAQVDESVRTIADSALGATAVAEEVSAAAEELSAQVEEMTAQAEDLAHTADELRTLVGQFDLGGDAEGSTGRLASAPRRQHSQPAPLARAS